MRRVLLAASICLLALLSPYASALDEQIRVGVYENAPIVYSGEKGDWQGMSIEVLKAIAEKEGWSLHFVPCEWHGCVSMLEKGQIDLQVYIAYSKERDLIFDYNQENLLINWGAVFVKPNSEIINITHLKGKKVVMMKKSILPAALKKLLKVLASRIMWERVLTASHPI